MRKRMRTPQMGRRMKKRKNRISHPNPPSFSASPEWTLKERTIGGVDFGRKRGTRPKSPYSDGAQEKTTPRYVGVPTPAQFLLIHNKKKIGGRQIYIIDRPWGSPLWQCIESAEFFVWS